MIDLDKEEGLWKHWHENNFPFGNIVRNEKTTIFHPCKRLIPSYIMGKIYFWILLLSLMRNSHLYRSITSNSPMKLLQCRTLNTSFLMPLTHYMMIMK
jgi:hypothetical protein